MICEHEPQSIARMTEDISPLCPVLCIVLLCSLYQSPTEDLLQITQTIHLAQIGEICGRKSTPKALAGDSKMMQEGTECGLTLREMREM